jgi:hypothetical protein
MAKRATFIPGQTEVTRAGSYFGGRENIRFKVSSGRVCPIFRPYLHL